MERKGSFSKGVKSSTWRMARSQSWAMWRTRAGCLRADPCMVMSMRLALETTCALVRKVFLLMRNPVPVPPVNFPEFQGLE